MSDGGDGFGAVLGELTGARERCTPTVDAAHRPLRALWRLDEKRKTAIIDSAGIIGLAMLPAKKFHPFQLDSFGVGKVMRAAAKAGAVKGIVGLGGSATNDGGFGLARALGWTFFNKNKEELTQWPRLLELAEARPPKRPLPWKLTVAVDVNNPLLGAKGCSRIFGPQKGLQPRDIERAEKCLDQLASVLKDQHGIRCGKTHGAGAAGGLGFGLLAFAGARLDSGFDVFARCAKLDDRIRRADLVITGEGRMDIQTYMGKGVGQIARRCLALGVPCLALAGIVQQPARARRWFVKTRALTDIAGPDRAQSHAGRYLQQLAAETAETFTES
jgi:glycerate kinase